MNKEQLRTFLIDHLDKCVTPYENRRNRDSPSAQESQATMRMYLRAGCDFKLVHFYGEEEIQEEELEPYLSEQDRDIIYISIFHYEFEDKGDWHTSYSPHPKYLEYCINNGNKDWY